MLGKHINLASGVWRCRASAARTLYVAIRNTVAMPDLAIWTLYIILACLFVWLFLEIATKLEDHELRAFHGPAQHHGDAATPLMRQGDMDGSRAQSER